MKIVKIVLALIVIIAIGGVIYFALTDISVQQKDVVKEIPHERFNDAQ